MDDLDDLRRDATLRCTSWLRTFVNKVGDHMPMSKDIHLPSCLEGAVLCSLIAVSLNMTAI